MCLLAKFGLRVTPAGSRSSPVVRLSVAFEIVLSVSISRNVFVISLDSPFRVSIFLL